MKKSLFCILSFVIFFGNVKASSIDSDLTSLISSTNNLISSAFLKGHPVGSIYETLSSDESTIAKMAAKYGGTWEVYGENKVLRGTTGTAGATNNHSSVTLVASQIPSLNATGTKAVQTVTSASTGSGYTVTYTSSSRTTTSNGSHTHSFSLGGNGITLGANANASGIPNDYGFTHVANSGLWYNHNKKRTTVESGGGHTHSYSDYYAKGSNISGVESHTHNVTFSETTVISSYANNASSFSVEDSYITVYRYKRVS